MTGSMEAAISEIERRRKYQEDYNKKHGITPKTVIKPVREKIVQREETAPAYEKTAEYDSGVLESIKAEALTPYDKKKMIKRLEREMKKQAEELHFELAIKIRDKIRELKT
jgi:excinuclease ABC subunit B